MKPVINLDELEIESHDRGSFGSRYGVISDRIGARKLGYNLTICPPGKRACPFHNHHTNEEMFLILEGEGLLRFGDDEYPLRPNDVIACPPGNRDVAHQIINTGSTELKYLALSTRERTEVVEYPDSDKIGVMVGPFGDQDLRAIFRAEQTVDYFDREE
ncbi:MAG TPA: cupin domain-containing protein [Candidatus Polarisedimenticolaceae bacterium]|nr:cupin domain-containing protein [Candidatus Polarisedimenticolaceae bacterium]